MILGRLSPRSLSIAIALIFAACGGTKAGDLFIYPPDSGESGESGIEEIEAGGSDAQADAGRDTGAADSGHKDSGTKDVEATDVQVQPPPADLSCTPTSGQTCDLRTEYCCRAPTSYQCRPQGQSCTGLRVTCAEAADCEFRNPGGGEVCCGTVNGQSLVTSTACAPPDQCLTGDGKVVICNPSDSDPCPLEGQCGESTFTLEGFYICK